MGRNRVMIGSQDEAISTDRIWRSDIQKSRQSGKVQRQQDKLRSCFICKRYGKIEYHNFKDCEVLKKLDGVLEEEKRILKDTSVQNGIILFHYKTINIFP